MSESETPPGAEPDVAFSLTGKAPAESDADPGERRVAPPVAESASGGRRRVADGLPPLRPLWARWVTVAGVCAALDSRPEVAVVPSKATFDSDGGSGSTLSLLPGGRAVLSGGWAGSHAEVGALYTGAPSWVAGAVLNPRVESGSLAFCYWWENGTWRMGESPHPPEVSDALPPIWTDRGVIDHVRGLLQVDAADEERAEQLGDAIETLFGAADLSVVTRDLVAAIFDDPVAADVDSAYLQFDMAGLASVLPTPLSESEAIAVVRDYILDRDLETPGYPVSGLVASRVSVGWMVYVPAPAGQVMLGRAIFYVADDGELERSSSSTPPSAYSIGFEERFRQRLGIS
ncbi:MAG: hypothetical protein HOQ24_04670 [Mycobacteriaceae bacterium]|nr:hypothetical protein [Mycobacteriaceae bacterium]